MPALNNMNTETLQLDGLRKVRSAAVSSFKKLNEEEKRIRRLFPNINFNCPHGGTHQYEGTQRSQVEGDMYHPHSYHHESIYPAKSATDALQSSCGGKSMYYHNQSQAEQTLSRYGNTNPNKYNQTSMHMPAQAGHNDNMYPYNTFDPRFLSKFSIGFRGCFKCGSWDHWNRNQCSVGDSNDPSMVQNFNKP